MTFKKGDRVKILDKTATGWRSLEDLKKSTSFEETYPDFPYGTVINLYPEDDLVVVNGDFYSPSDLELVEEKKHQFKKGDRVKLLDYKMHADYRRHDDEVAEILENKPNYFDHEIEWSDGETSYADKENMILVTEKKVAEEEEPKYIHHFQIPERYLKGEIHGLRFISPRRKPMAKLSTLAKKLLDPDTKALVKAGVLNNELEVADEEFVLSYLVNLHKEGLAKEARKKLREDKKDAEEE